MHRFHPEHPGARGIAGLQDRSRGREPIGRKRRGEIGTRRIGDSGRLLRRERARDEAEIEEKAHSDMWSSARKLHGIVPQHVAPGKKELTGWRVKVLTCDRGVWRILALARPGGINDPP